MVGAAYFVGIVIAATASAGYINPAVALGSRAWSAAYVLGPLVGGLIGVNLYTYLMGAADVVVTGGRSVVARSEAAEESAPAASGSRGVTVKRTTVRRRKATTRK
jgi:hypothetical protein